MPRRSEPADVVIVGAGASGGVAARRLAEAGFSVVCLEQGSWPDRASFRGAEDDGELVAMKQWSTIPGVRANPADYPIDLTDSDMQVGNFNGVGGATVLWAACWIRLLPSDFRTRSLDGVGDDWPLTYAELAPFYDRVDRDFGVSGLGGNPAYPPYPDPPLPALPIGEGGLRVARAHARLGWHWWPETNAILSAPYEGRHACVLRGTCNQGCGEGAKASTDLTHFPRAIEHGCQVITDAYVHRIPLDGRGRAAGVEWLDRDGTAHFQPADVVLCAANAIGTARLLLNSSSSRFPDGLANSSGLVGRRLMLHPPAVVTGLFDDELRSWRGPAGASIQSLEFYATDEDRGFSRGARWLLAPTGGPLGATFAARPGGAWGTDHHRSVAERVGRSIRWSILCEDLPDEDNRVELSPRAVDAAGMPGVKLRYTFSENTLAMMTWHEQRAEESLRAAGARQVGIRRPAFNSHLMGTARMGDDRSTSVVDRWGMSHDVPNLGIIDGSVFVTASGVNPTATICALALRNVEHLIARSADVPKPDRTYTATVGGRPRPPRHLSSLRLPVQGADAVPIGAVERDRLGRLADVLIPADSRMPAASAVGVHTTLLDRVLQSRPDLREPLERALGLPFEDSEKRLAVLAVDDPSAHRAVLVAVAGAYYLDADVRRRIGYPGQEAIIFKSGEIPQYVLEDLLEPVLARAEELSPAG